MKTPKFITKLSAVINARKKKLNAATRTAPRTAMSDYDEAEPTTKLSSAFFVVFILHVVAIGGIYAFNGIKASRGTTAPTPPAKTDNAKVPATTAVKDAKPAAQAGPATAATAAHSAENRVTATPSPSTATPKTNGPKQYQVKAGDNPTKIAIAFGLKTEELLAANNLKDGAILHANQMLTIPTPKPVVAEAHKTEPPAKQTDVRPTRTTPGLHIVKKGDTAFSIAKTYGLTSEEILRLNKISDAKKIQLGQALKIPPKKG